MSKRAEEAAMKAYPVEMTPLNYQDLIDQFGGKTEIDVNTYSRCLFQEGYEQAEKDIISIIESRISEIIGDAQPKPVLRMELQDLIRRIKEE